MKYDNVRVGMNSRLDALQAAILRVKLRAFAEHEVADVNERAAMYDELLVEAPVRLPHVPDGFLSSWAQYTVILPEDTDRDGLQTHLSSRGIPTMVYYPKPMHEQRAFDGECFALACPVAENLCAKVLSLPMGPYYTPSDSLSVFEGLHSIAMLER